MIIIKPLIGLLMLLHPHPFHPVPMIDPGAAEACFIQQTNATRASKGLSTLPVSGSLSGQARSHSAVMASSNSLYHSTGDQYPGNWIGLGENVGVGPTCDDIESAFIASPHHYENIVNPTWTTIGVGVALSPDGATVWVTVSFEEFQAAPPPPARVPPPAPAPVPVPVLPAPVRTTAVPLPVRTTAPVPVKTTAAPVPVKTVPVPAPATPAPVVPTPTPSLPPVAVPVPEPTATATSPTATLTPTSTVALPTTAQTLVAAQTPRGIVGLGVAVVLCLAVGGLWGVRDRKRR